jgi:mannose-6-phosphate isomerase-like protein (cupin superfamily)
LLGARPSTSTTGHPLHMHDFAQVWYILEGQFQIGEGTYGPGTMLFYPDPHWEAPL